MKIHNQAGIATIAVVIIAALVVIGGGAAAYILTDGFGVNKPNQAGQTAATETASGDSSDASSDSGETLPSDFPANVPIYQPSSIATISTNTPAAAESYVIGFMAEGSADEVAAFYQSELSTNGWTVNQAVSSDTRFSAQNGSTIITVGVIEAGNKAVFTVTAPKE